LGALPQPKFAGAGGAQVAYPLPVAPRGNEVPASVVFQKVHRCRSPRAAGTSPDRQNPRTKEARAMTGQERDGPVEDVACEPTRGAVVNDHGHSLTARCGNRLAPTP